MGITECKSFDKFIGAVEELQAFNNLTKITVPMDVELAGKLGFNVE